MNREQKQKIYSEVKSTVIGVNAALTRHTNLIWIFILIEVRARRQIDVIIIKCFAIFLIRLCTGKMKRKSKKKKINSFSNWFK